MTSSESIDADTSQCVVVTCDHATDVSNSSSSGGASSSSSRPARLNSVRRRSYADWITRAIQSSAECKMTLAGIYQWMAHNVPGLYEKRNLHSSKGWKNAVRHTLSVNKRFEKSSQPNVRAALWSLAPSVQQSPAESSRSNEAQLSPISNGTPELPPSTLFTSGISTTCVTTPCLQSSPLAPSTSAFFPSTVATPTSNSNAVVTQTLELHQQDGTVRTVTVPKPFPIHVVGDYRLVTVDTKPFLPHVVTSSSG